MYRAVAWKAAREGLALDDQAAIAALAAGASFDFEGGRIRIDSHDVTEAIRTSDVDQAAAGVARLPAVREVLVRGQRALGSEGGVVMEGRDIGTVVFPDADVKIFLDASPEERARRRAADPSHTSGRTGRVDEVATALAARDALDRTRAASPLTMAADAVQIDTTGVPIDEVVRRVLAVVERES
jgi:cytidylate kinase